MITLGARIGAYTFVRELGRGGMGTVYLAEDHALGRKCAIKVLHPHLAHDEVVMERFRREVKAAAAIDHPAIVKSRPIEQLPEEGSWCCVMEYVDAPTLTEFCKRRGEPLPLRMVLEIIGPICEAFDLLHALHIVHRDLKPDNVLITMRNGRLVPRVLDFGIAKSTDSNEPGLTRPGAAPGTAAFMAPEQAKGAAVDRTCDVYSLGVMIYWMSTGGRLPYEVPEGLVYLHQITEPPADPRRYVPSIPELAASVMLTAINEKSERRPRTMGALALMLARAYPDGTEILRAGAPHLLVVGNLEETLRSPRIPSARSEGSVWKYDYGPVLGRGGMAEVVRATLRGQGQFAVARAIKLILPEHSASPVFAEMFHAEARSISLLDHRNIVRVTDHDVDPQGRPYIAMEFVDGLDLNKLAQSGRIPHAVTIFVLCEVLEALDYAHDLPPTSPLASPQEIAARGNARGLVHRDVSHHNVLVSWLGDVKLSDFGIAKIRDATAADGSTLVKGKASYMSPEQASASKKIDGRSDLWSIGVMLWELLTGGQLFNQETIAATISAVMFAEIIQPAVVFPNVPPDLNEITMRLLERDPGRRYRTAREVITALRACRATAADGRAELLRLLAERFPDRARRIADPAPANASQAPANASQAPANASQAPANASQAPSPEPVTSEEPRAFAVSSPELPGLGWLQPSTTGHASGQSMPAVASRPRAWRWFAALGATAAAVTTLALVARHGAPGADHAREALMKPQDVPRAAAESAAVPAVAMPSPGAARAAAPASPSVSLTVDTAPSGAHVRIEAPGVPMVAGRTPVTMTIPQAVTVHIRAELDGYEPASRDATVGDQNATIVVPLPANAAPIQPAKTVERKPIRAPLPAKPDRHPSPPAEAAPGIIE